MRRLLESLWFLRRACIVIPALGVWAGWGLARLDAGELALLAVLSSAAACAVLGWGERIVQQRANGDREPVL
jgi:hypothetical protein